MTMTVTPRVLQYDSTGVLYSVFVFSKTVTRNISVGWTWDQWRNGAVIRRRL